MANTTALNTVCRELITAASERKAPLSIRRYADSDRERWDKFVRGEPVASFFHLSGWMRVIERTFGYRCCALYAERNGEITGVLPLFQVKNWILGRCLISTPLAVYGGIASRDEETYLALLDHAKAMAHEQQVQYLELRNHTGKIEPGFHANPRYVTFRCELSDEPDANLKRLPRDTRYMIRKAQKAGLTVRHGTELSKEFYDLMALSLRRHGTPMFPESLFMGLIEELPGQIDVLIVYANEKPVSGVFTFMFGDTVLPYYAGASPEAPKLAANNLMYWELMRWAAEKGFRRFDFGRSKTGTGAYSFKTQWNMTPSPLPYQVLLVRKKTAPDFSPANPRFAKAVKLWSHLPLWVTKHAGPHVVRWFP